MLLDRYKRAQRNLERLSYLPLADTQMQFLHSAAECKQEIIQQIRQARQRIYVTALYWQNDAAGQQILDEIFQAKRSNPQLDVKILVDWHRGQRNLLGAEKSATNADWYCEQRKLNGFDDQESLFFGVPVNTREVFGVLHIKGFIFDDTVLYSGASINNIYLQQEERYRYDRYHLIHHQALADSMVSFIQEFLLEPSAVYPLDCEKRPRTKDIRASIRAFRRHLAQDALYRIKTETCQSQLSLVPLYGLGTGHNILNRTIGDLFCLTEQKLTICTPYFNFPGSLQRRIKRLLAKGKQVEIIVGDKVASDFYIPPEQPFKMAGALPYLYEKNLYAFARKFENEIEQEQLIIRLWRDGDNSYHLKGVWVDDRYMLLTGNNLNPRAWRLDAENGILINDPHQQLQGQIQQELDEIRRHTQRLMHYGELEPQEQYPEPVQKLLRKFERIKADKLVKMIL